MIANLRTVLRDLFAAAVAAASPAGCVPQNLPPRPRGRTIVVGAGKAAAAMASAVEHHSDAPLDGLVVTRYGHGVPSAREFASWRPAIPFPTRRDQPRCNRSCRWSAA